MKRIYLAIAILILLPVLIFGGQFYLKKSTNDMKEILNTAQDYSEQKKNDRAVGEVREFIKQWHKNKSIMETFVRHSELDTINQNSAKLEPYLTGGEESEFNAECEELKVQLEHIYNAEKFTIDNIL